MEETHSGVFGGANMQLTASEQTFIEQEKKDGNKKSECSQLIISNISLVPNLKVLGYFR